MVYPSFILLISWHQHFFGPQINLNCLFLLPASTCILAKYFNFRIHQCSISKVFSLFLGTAYMFLCNNVFFLLLVFSSWVTLTLEQNFWRCVQTQKVQITHWCLNFNTVHKGKIQCPPPHFTICEECARRPCWESFPLPGGRSGAPPTPSPWLRPVTSALTESRIHHWKNPVVACSCNKRRQLPDWNTHRSNNRDRRLGPRRRKQNF